ncbi:MAG: DNA primase [Simkaniaceae bacterium]
MFSKSSLELLRDKVDLIELISTYVPLKKNGSTYKGLCPFHEEKTPSFLVRIGDTHYHCFGCGAHGDSIAFLMSHLKLSFAEAVEMLADRFGVILEKSEEREEVGPSKKVLREALLDAADFFHFFLLHSEEGQDALNYLYRRGIDLNFIRMFKIGLSPKLPEIFQKALFKRGHKKENLEIAGLVKGGRDFFIHRLMFPICDGVGHVIGFSGRKMSESASGPKYVNTPETPLFKKSKVLFGLSHSKRRIIKEKRAIIVEGQIDALRLIAEGFDLTLAGQGTAFGRDHAHELIALGVQTVFLGLDGDQAGIQAAIKIGDLFQREGVEVFVLSIPKGSDPDSYLMEEGPESFQKLLDQAPDYLSFLVTFYRAARAHLSPAQTNQVVLQISERIRSWDHPLMVHESLRRLSELMKVPESALKIQKTEEKPLFIKKSGSITQEDIDPDRILEADLLRWLLLVGGDLIEIVKANLREVHFRNSVCRRLFKRIVEASERDETPDIMTLLSNIDSAEDQLFLSELIQKRINKGRARELLVESIKKILVRHWMDERESIRMRIQMERLGDDELMELAKKFDQLKHEAPQVVIPTPG